MRLPTGGEVPAWSWTERVAMTALMGMDRVVRSNCVRNIGWADDGEKAGMDSGGGWCWCVSRVSFGGISMCVFE
jgi:hypothetical protein